MDVQGLTQWDWYFLDLAEFIAKERSKDPSTKVGAVIVAPNNRVISMGYNGFPRGVADTKERLEDRELKLRLVVHGEMNAMLFAREPLDGATLYTWPFMPCSTCAGAVIQSGIKKVITPRNDAERWIESFKITRIMFQEAGVELIECQT